MDGAAGGEDGEEVRLDDGYPGWCRASPGSLKQATSQSIWHVHCKKGNN